MIGPVTNLSYPVQLKESHLKSSGEPPFPTTNEVRLEERFQGVTMIKICKCCPTRVLWAANAWHTISESVGPAWTDCSCFHLGCIDLQSRFNETASKSKKKGFSELRFIERVFTGGWSWRIQICIWKMSRKATDEGSSSACQQWQRN